MNYQYNNTTINEIIESNEDNIDFKKNILEHNDFLVNYKNIKYSFCFYSSERCWIYKQDDNSMYKSILFEIIDTSDLMKLINLRTL